MGPVRRKKRVDYRRGGEAGRGNCNKKVNAYFAFVMGKIRGQKNMEKVPRLT